LISLIIIKLSQECPHENTMKLLGLLKSILVLDETFSKSKYNRVAERIMNDQNLREKLESLSER